MFTRELDIKKQRQQVWNLEFSFRGFTCLSYSVCLEYFLTNKLCKRAFLCSKPKSRSFGKNNNKKIHTKLLFFLLFFRKIQLRQGVQAQMSLCFEIVLCLRALSFSLLEGNSRMQLAWLDFLNRTPEWNRWFHVSSVRWDNIKEREGKRKHERELLSKPAILCTHPSLISSKVYLRLAASLKL